MFDKKKTSLFSVPVKPSEGANSFVNAGLKKSTETVSGNGALKYSTTGNDFVDQFGKIGSYKQPRSFTDISNDCQLLWSQNAKMMVMFTFFLRMITRITQLFSGDKTSTTQRGAGLKHESIMRMLWIYTKAPDTFWKNIQLFISVGSWKDIITMLSYDLQYNGWKGRVLDWDKFGELIMVGLENENSTNLVKKYLPHIKANSVCKTLEAQADNIIAKWICSLLFGTKDESTGHTYKKYRLLKTSGTAHEWQQIISKRLYDKLNFNTVHGRALALMVSSKFLANNKLEDKYQEWISTKPIAKFTGYVHELFKTLPSKKYQIDTLNAQFKGLVEVAKNGIKDNTSLIVVRDTSGSMSSPAKGTNQACGNIAKALALFFSYMLPAGHFANSWIEFNSNAKMHTWKGDTPYDKWVNDHSQYIGDTNFLSVIRLFVNIKNQGISEDQFPTGIICISDSEFNPANLNSTNVEQALNMLTAGGFSKEYISNFKIILWNLQSNYYGSDTGKKFETYGDVNNVYYFSGYDASIMAFLTGTTASTGMSEPKNAKELFEAAMNQEVLNLIEL